MTTRGVNFFDQHFFFSNRLVQLLVGLSSDKNSNHQLFAYYVITVCLIPGFIYQLYQFFTMDFILYRTIVELRKIIAGLIMSVAFSNNFYHSATMKCLLYRFKLDCEQFVDKDELKIIEKYGKQTKFYAYTIIVLFSFYVISITSSCILNVILYLFGILKDDQLTLPLFVNNVRNAGWLYYCLLIYQMISFYIILTIGCVSFITYLVIIQHACCQFKIIISKMQKLFINDQNYIRNTISRKISWEEFNWIIDIIMRYKKVTEYVDLINNSLNIMYLIAVFLSMIIMVIDLLYIFQLSIALQNAMKIIEFSIYITGSIFAIYINFYIGQKLLNYSNAVFEELTQVPFYMCSIETQKLLLFMIVRSMKPCMLSIGGLFVSSHEIFAKLIQKAFSFAMVCRTIQ